MSSIVIIIGLTVLCCCLIGVVVHTRFALNECEKDWEDLHTSYVDCQAENSENATALFEVARELEDLKEEFDELEEIVYGASEHDKPISFKSISSLH